MTPRLPFLDRDHVVVDGPWDVATEQRWRIEEDGRRRVVGQLAPDLARDESIRRRYVRDVERVRDLPALSVAPTLAVGPAPDPRAPDAVAPWRLREDPPGVSLEQRLERAPLPLEEVTAIFTAVADAIHAVHQAGAVIRDLQPREIVLTDDGRTVLVDIGLARVDLLSSHTASSLMLQGSRYAAPEQLLETAIDQRSDLFSLGVMMWYGLTGTFPFGDDPVLLSDRPTPPDLRQLVPEIPEPLAGVVHACLADDSSRRPASAADIAGVLRGGHSAMLATDTTSCQHCGAPLRVAQRLCLSCGRVGIRFHHAGPDEPAYAIDLLEVGEDNATLRWLVDFLEAVSAPPFRKPEFIIGSVHMYAMDERRGKIRMPARLYGRLTRDTAIALQERMNEQGLSTRVCQPDATRIAALAVPVHIAASAALAFALTLFGLSPWWALVPAIAVLVWLLIRWTNRVSDRHTPPQFTLRTGPAALPASDPLVARLCALLGSDTRPAVREVVGELALVVQRLVDHRASLGDGTSELEVVTAPLCPLVGAVEQQVRALDQIDADLDTLEEGAMVRALAASEARGDPPSSRVPILQGLDRLRALEDRRAEIMHRLLEARSLLVRTVDMGLRIADPDRAYERDVTAAVAMLEAG